MTDGLPVAPSLEPTLAQGRSPRRPKPLSARDVLICALAVALAVVTAFVAQLLTGAIALVTNFAFHARFSTESVGPWPHHLGSFVIVVPVIGGLIVGAMARYGSAAIRGHGIPEAMEQVLTNHSRVPARMTFLKPASAAIAIGTGGPFGAEGPIIATGGALGSLLGQLVRTSAMERKTLLAAGAAAGMSATFGTPVSAVLLAIELLLFEYRPRSLVPVAMASSVATAVRFVTVGTGPVFGMPAVPIPSGTAFVTYVLMGALLGLVALAITRGVYAVEDAFERLPLHFMWWPALGGLVVGTVGLLAPRTLGVGYDNIEQILSGDLVGEACILLCALKLLSWTVALGSGTSGGTLAPLLTVGGGFGSALGSLAILIAPHAGIDVRVAAAVGMAATFASASRAFLASVVFAFETTRNTATLLPLLGGSCAAFLVSCLFMRNSIMTEKIERRGVRVVSEYATDFLARLHVRDVALRPVVVLAASESVRSVRAWFAARSLDSSHQGFPVIDETGDLVGVITRREIYEHTDGAASLRELVTRKPIVIEDDASLRDAADRMAEHRVGRLPVVARHAPRKVIGIITRSDLVEAHARRIEEHVVGTRKLARVRT